MFLLDDSDITIETIPCEITLSVQSWETLCNILDILFLDFLSQGQHFQNTSIFLQTFALIETPAVQNTPPQTVFCLVYTREDCEGYCVDCSDLNRQYLTSLYFQYSSAQERPRHITYH